MASLATKMANCGLGNCLATSARLLGAVSVNKVPSANIYSKTSGQIEPRLKPWDYKKLGFNQFYHLIDGTTKRFTANSKMIVVEGPPAIGKTEFAKNLADELDMKFVPGFTMDDFYINPYGYDLRLFDYRVKHVRCLSYDEKKFSQDPTGQDGGLDRMLWTSHMQRYGDYVNSLAHIFNTGEGIVTERSPHSDFIYVNAAYEQGWICKTTRDYYWRVRNMMITEVLRPNLIIHLDAPVDVVQANIRARSATTHPWEANSPVWENTEYMTSLYKDKMMKYLHVASESSEVLSYDWSEGGDFEVVVEDIEALNMDYHDKYDKQQKDWRLLTEDMFATKRNVYTDQTKLMAGFAAPFFSCDKLIFTPEEGLEMEFLLNRLPGNRYHYGFNTVMNDPEPFFNFGRLTRGTKYKGRIEIPYRQDVDLDHEFKVAANRKALGDKDWWLN